MWYTNKRPVWKQTLPGVAGLVATALFWVIGALRVFAVQSVSLAWDPSPDTNVVGYFLHYGTASGSYPNRIDVGNTTNAAVPGLIEGRVYYFVATAYNAAGLESDPSNELMFTVPGILKLTRALSPGAPASVAFPAALGQNYFLEASENLKSWHPVWVTVAATNGWLQFQDPQSAYLPQRFYRLAMVAPATIKLTPGSTPQSPVTVNFPAVVGRTYVLQASTDLNSWQQIWTTSVATNGWVQFQDLQSPALPKRFYRLVLY